MSSSRFTHIRILLLFWRVRNQTSKTPTKSKSAWSTPWIFPEARGHQYGLKYREDSSPNCDVPKPQGRTGQKSVDSSATSTALYIYIYIYIYMASWLVSLLASKHTTSGLADAATIGNAAWAGVMKKSSLSGEMTICIQCLRRNSLCAMNMIRGYPATLLLKQQFTFS